MPKKKATLQQPKSVQVIPEKIHLTKITITNAQVNGPSEVAGTLDGVVMKVGAKTLFNQEKACKVILTIDLFKEHEEPQKEVKANFTIEFFLQVENMDDFIVHKSPEEFQLDSRLGSAIMGIVYSTARGIILTRTAGTALQGTILPVIDPSGLLN